MTDLKDDLAALRIERAPTVPGGGRGWVKWVVALVMVAAAGYAGWQWWNRPRPIEIEVATVTQRAAGTQATVLNASGYVTARRRATVSSKITGKVIEVNVDEGMAVREGQILARLDDTTPRAALALAVAQAGAARGAWRESEVRLAEARLTLNRFTQLAKDGIATQSDVDKAQAEVDSLIARIATTKEQVAEIIKSAPGLLRDGQSAVATAELYVIIDMPKKSTGTPANVPMRGIEPAALAVRDEVKIVEGRMFEFGTNEVIVGRAASGQFAGLTVGSTVVSGQATWNVVGLFDSGGTVNETEIWGDVRVLQGVYRRGNSYQLILARLQSSAEFDVFRDWLITNPQLNVQVQSETEYYAQQSRSLSGLIQGVGFGIAFLMGIGAVFGAILTMYTAVSTRSREIATLRALGFNSGSVVISVMAESLTLGLIGGLIGGAGAYFGFNGYQTSTINFQTFSQVAFAFRVTPELLATGLIYALLLGLIGGLFPAIRAARLPIPTALREL